MGTICFCFDKPTTISVLLIFFTFINCVSPRSIIEQNCNFINLDTCVRVDIGRTLSFDEMKAECEQYELQLLSPLADDLGSLRKILFFRYPEVHKAYMNRKVNNQQDRDDIERLSGLNFAPTSKPTGVVVYRWEDNQLYTVPPETRLPLVCWSKFKPRYRCPENFKYYAKRPTCFFHYDRRMPNEQCKEYCRSIKSNLGSFHSIEEKDFFVQHFGGSEIWVGTRFPAYLNNEKHVSHVGVAEAAYNMDGSKWVNFKGAFKDTEPNGSGEENCVEMVTWWELHGYNDVKCSANYMTCFCETAPDQTNVQY